MGTDLKPKSRSLSYGGELSGLEMGESESGEGLVLLGEVGETGDNDGELVEEETETIPEEDEVGVAVGRGREVSGSREKGTERAERTRSRSRRWLPGCEKASRQLADRSCR